jgi:hypothetical protein
MKNLPANVFACLLFAFGFLAYTMCVGTAAVVLLVVAWVRQVVGGKP